LHKFTGWIEDKSKIEKATKTWFEYLGN